MQNIALTPVTSSQIEAIGYDPSTKTLAIKFKRGGLYHYSNVTPEVHAALMGNGVEGHSVGSFFIKNIKNRPDLYPFKKVEDAAAAKQK